MNTLSRFVAQFTNLIVAVLSCFDRVIFKGYLPFTYGPALEGFVDHVLKIRHKDFMAFAQEHSEALVDFAKRLVEEVGAEYHYLQGAHRKDKLVDKLLRQRPISDGLICILYWGLCFGASHGIGYAACDGSLHVFNRHSVPGNGCKSSRSCSSLTKPMRPECGRNTHRHSPPDSPIPW